MELIKDEDIARQNQNKNRDKLFRILDRGIDDMEAGRELPLEEAFEKIAELRDMRRSARA